MRKNMPDLLFYLPVNIAKELVMRINRHTSATLFIAFVALFYAQTAISKTIDITIRDMLGKPIPNAVIAFPTISAAQTTHTAVMDQVNKQFSPHVLMVQKKQFVDFPNSDAIRHHVYSFSQGNEFEIRLFSGSEARPLAFESAGIVVLGCNIHDSMIAYIYVNDGELTILTDNKGRASIDLDDNLDKTAFTRMTIWHSELSPLQTQRVESSMSNNSDTHDITLPFILESQEVETNSGFKKKFGD